LSVSSAFLWRFLEDVWDILPTEDRQLFETYWSAQLQIASNLEQKVLELGLSTHVATVPVFLTERWNQFVMNEESCDLFKQTDLLTLNVLVPAAISKETVLYDTLKVSTPSGQIQYEEDVVFFDASPKTLRYGKIIKGTVAVVFGTQQYTQNRDYVVNLETGTIQALDNGRISPTDSVTVRYQHSEYTRDLDYAVNEVSATVARLPSSAIASGEAVAVAYTYNGTATLPMTGTEGAVSSSTLIDGTKDFSAVTGGRTLTILSGPNAGAYTINAVVGQSALTVQEQFPEEQDGDVEYAINAFPHGVKVSKQVVSIPHLRDRVDVPSVAMVEGVDYVVRDGILAVRSAFPLSTLGPSDLRVRQMWAETTKLDKETPYRNFGVLINFYRKNSEAYKLALQGLWYTFWTGSTPGNLQRGLHILLGLPFAKRTGTVTRVDENAAQIDVTDDRGQILTYTIPTGLDPVVDVGDAVARFDSLTTGVSIIDRNNEPGFVESRLGRAGISRFLTANATRGLGDTDETKALKLLENHLFLPQVLTDAIVQRINVDELVTFLDNMKPQWTEYVFSFAVEEDESIKFSEDTPPIEMMIDLTTTVGNNQWNQSFAFDNFVVDSANGEIIAGGTQAAGNFRDVTIDFGALDIDDGDTIRIESNGRYLGEWKVLKQVNIHTLSLEIPDADIQVTLGLQYVAIPSERNLDNDAIGLGLEHIVVPGTAFSAPSSLNTKTNANLAGLSISNAQIKGLLLVDLGNVGGRVQTITAADKTINEISVAAPPGVVVRNHEVASCALVRTDNTGPTVTDAFAI
jgi:hypothetical protein